LFHLNHFTIDLLSRLYVEENHSEIGRSYGIISMYEDGASKSEFFPAPYCTSRHRKLCLKSMVVLKTASAASTLTTCSNPRWIRGTENSDGVTGNASQTDVDFSRNHC
jgi:hypothetical protein